MTNSPIRKNGFTLIEILVAATIIAILTAIGLVSFSVANKQARDAKRKADMEQVRAALEIYRSDHTTYPVHTVSGNLAVLIVGTNPVFSTYLTSSSISDPKSTNPVYRYISDGSTYQVCSTLEATGLETCLNNP